MIEDLLQPDLDWLVIIRFIRYVIAYSEWCRIQDLQRRFSFGTRDQALALKSFCVAEFYQSIKNDRTASDIDILRGMENAPTH